MYAPVLALKDAEALAEPKRSDQEVCVAAYPRNSQMRS